MHSAGVITHALGMRDKHRLEAQHNAERGPLVVALCWIRWLLLGGVLVSVFVDRRHYPTGREPTPETTRASTDSTPRPCKFRSLKGLPAHATGASPAISS